MVGVSAVWENAAVGWGSGLSGTSVLGPSVWGKEALATSVITSARRVTVERALMAIYHSQMYLMKP